MSEADNAIQQTEVLLASFIAQKNAAGIFKLVNGAEISGQLSEPSKAGAAALLKEAGVAKFRAAAEAFMGSARSGIRAQVYTEPWVHHYKNRLNDMREAQEWVVAASRLEPTGVSSAMIEELANMIKKLSKMAGV